MAKACAHQKAPLRFQANDTAQRKAMYDLGMGSLYDFIKAAGGKGWPSMVGTATFIAVSILEHFWNHEVAAYAFVVIASATFCWGAFAAWSDSNKRVKELEEKVADRYPRLVGSIERGYLDIGKQCVNGQWVESSTGCVATFYVKVANHSQQDAWIALPPDFKITLDGADYVGRYAQLSSSALYVHDSELKGDRRIFDMFGFSVGGALGVFQKPRLHFGWVVFNLEGSRNELASKKEVIGSATMTLRDSLGGVHPIKSSVLRFHLDEIGVTP